jgi:alpha-tubulin suppressor-like RCC1 family protein
MQKTIQLFIYSNVPDPILLDTAILDTVNKISINDSNQTLDQFYDDKCTRIGFMWDNNMINIPFGITDLTINDYTFVYFKKEFYDYIKLFQNPLIVDLITCDLNTSIFIQEVNILKSVLPNVLIEYSVNKTGNSPKGDWIMESNNQSIKAIYFNDNILNYRYTLGNIALHCGFIAPSNNVWTYGRNNAGQLGNGTNTDSNVPVQVTGINGIAVACGGSHTVALLGNGTVQTWGDNSFGQLGNGTNIGSNVPVTVSGITNAIAVACGGYHTAALLQNGSIMTWGRGGFGQLGNNAFSNSNVPVTVFGITTAIAIACGTFHTAAILGDGTVQTWGYGVDGELGNGTNSGSNIPVTVSGINGIAIACGDSSTAVVLNDNTVRTWGVNTFGQLGNGTNIDSNVPVTVLGINTAIAAVACGKYHTAVVLQDSTARTWGRNNVGQLGNGTTTDSNVPVVFGITNIIAIACGESHTTVLLNTCKIMSSGDNSSGQLGNGTNINSSVPIGLSGNPTVVKIYDTIISSACCIDGDNLVTTARGIVPIKNVVAGDIVYSHGNEVKVLYCIVYSPVKEYVLIKKGTFGTDLPTNDLLIREGHPLLIDGEEIGCEKLINNDTIKKVTLDKYSIPYSLCTETRTHVTIEGIDIFTWSDKDWQEASVKNKIIWTRQ